MTTEKNSKTKGFKPAPKNSGNQRFSDGYQNRPMAGRFSELRSRIHTRHPSMRNAPAVNSLGNDGEDHINVYHAGRTALGKALAFTGDLQFTHKRYGKFRSVAGLMAYLSSKAQPDTFRTVPGAQVFSVKRRFDSDARVYNYRAVAADATWQKVKQHPAIAKELYESDLPFDVYYTETTDADSDSYIRVRLVGEYEWLVPALDEMRKALRGGREPNFSFLQSEEETRAEEKQTAARESVKATNRTISMLEREFKTKLQSVIGQKGIYFSNTAPNVTSTELEKWLKSDLKRYSKYHPTGTPTDDEQAFLENALITQTRRTTRLGYLFSIDGEEYLQYAVYEMHYGRKGEPRTGRIFVCSIADDDTPTTDVLVRQECKGVDLYGTFVLFGGKMLATVKLKPESVDCGAEPPIYTKDQIIEELRELEFSPLNDGTTQYRVVKLVQEIENRGEFTSPVPYFHEAVRESIDNHAKRWNDIFKLAMKSICHCSTVAYIIDTYSLINGHYAAYKLLNVELATSGDDHSRRGPIRVLVPFYSKRFERAAQKWAEEMTKLLSKKDNVEELIVREYVNESVPADKTEEVENDTPEVEILPLQAEPTPHSPDEPKTDGE
jgi:hypothetical protein